MARQARVKSMTGIYHVMLKGKSHTVPVKPPKNEGTCKSIQ
jgi:hypothetical protein